MMPAQRGAFTFLEESGFSSRPRSARFPSFVRRNLRSFRLADHWWGEEMMQVFSADTSLGRMQLSLKLNAPEGTRRSTPFFCVLVEWAGDWASRESFRKFVPNSDGPNWQARKLLRTSNTGQWGMSIIWPALQIRLLPPAGRTWEGLGKVSSFSASKD